MESNFTNGTGYPEALAALVPKNVEYIPRQVGDEATDLEVLEYALTSGENVLIVGPTGVAKTRLVRRHCELQGLAFLNIPGNEALDPDQLLGQPVQRADGSIGWRYGALPLAAKYGDACIYWDEINGLKPGISMAAHGILDDRKEVTLLQHGEDFDGPLSIRLADTAQNIATMNYGYKGTRVMNEATQGRFSIVLDFQYDPNVDQYLVGSPTLQKIFAAMRAAYTAGEMVTPSPTKRMEAFEKHVSALGYTFAVKNLVNTYHPDERVSVRKRFEAEENKLMGDYGLAWIDNTTT